MFICNPHRRFLSYATLVSSMDNCYIQYISLYYVVMSHKMILHFITLNLDKSYKKEATPHFAGCHINIL